MTLIEELSTLGVDTVEGLDRVMGDESLYEMMLGMFVDAIQNNPIALADFDAADREDLIRKIHTLKGTTGNLSLTPLFNGYNGALGLLRSNQPAQAKAEFQGLLSAQEKILDCIKRHQA